MQIGPSPSTIMTWSLKYGLEHPWQQQWFSSSSSWSIGSGLQFSNWSGFGATASHLRYSTRVRVSQPWSWTKCSMNSKESFNWVFCGNDIVLPSARTSPRNHSLASRANVPESQILPPPPKLPPALNSLRKRSWAFCCGYWSESHTKCYQPKESNQKAGKTRACYHYPTKHLLEELAKACLSIELLRSFAVVKIGIGDFEDDEFSADIHSKIPPPRKN